MHYSCWDFIVEPVYDGNLVFFFLSRFSEADRVCTKESYCSTCLVCVYLLVYSIMLELCSRVQLGLPCALVLIGSRPAKTNFYSSLYLVFSLRNHTCRL